MARAEKSTIDALLADISALKDHIAELAQFNVADAANGISRAAGRAGSAAVERSDEMLDSLRGSIRERPIVSLLGAFALGMSMAGLLKR